MEPRLGVWGAKFSSIEISRFSSTGSSRFSLIGTSRFSSIGTSRFSSTLVVGNVVLLVLASKSFEAFLF